MLFDIDIIDTESNVVFSCDGICRAIFNQFFIANCTINIHGKYEMDINDYKHAIVKLCEATQ